jgi:hypothetical protein
MRAKALARSESCPQEESCKARIDRAVRVSLAAALFVSSLTPAGAQAPQSFGETLDVRVVNIEAVVVDKDGNRVSGLNREDFRLRVDGKEVPIEYFTEVRAGDAVAQPEGAVATAGMPALEPGNPVGTSYLVFIDDFFAEPVDRNRTLDSAVQAAAQSDAGRPHGGGRLRRAQARHADHLEPVRAGARARARARQGTPASGLKRDAELRTNDRDRQMRGSSFDRPTAPWGFAP